jgi:ABC-type sugar transport system substrate-binding protein
LTMKENKRFFGFNVISMLVIFTLLLAACGNSTPSSSPSSSASESSSAPADTSTASASPSADQNIKIGYIVKTLGNTFWQSYAEGAKAAAKDLGVEIDVRDVPTESDFKAQLDVAMTMVNQDYSAIVAASITNTNLIPAIAEANKKNVPWIVVSEDQDEKVLTQMKAHVTAKVQLKFYDEGVLVGKYIADKLGGKGKVGIVEGMAGTSATRDRIQGIKDVFKDYPDLKIVSSQPGDWLREKARDVAAAMIQANPDINAIIANNDTMALGVSVAVTQAGKDGKILVTGDDGTDEAYQAITGGKLEATVDGVPYLIAYYSVYAAVKAAKEGADTLPDYMLKPFLVTKDNVAEVMKTAPVPIQAVFDQNENIYK